MSGIYDLQPSARMNTFKTPRAQSSISKKKGLTSVVANPLRKKYLLNAEGQNRTADTRIFRPKKPNLVKPMILVYYLISLAFLLLLMLGNVRYF